MNELADFVRARLDEIAEAARLASDGSGRGRWQAMDRQVQAVDGGDIAVAGFVLGSHTEPLKVPHARHIAMHDPETTLAECDARRRIVDEFRRCGPGTEGYVGLRFALQCLALPFAAHADYREEWRR